MKKEDEKENESLKAFKDRIHKEAQQGNIVFMTIEGPMVASLSEFVKQPAEGILYDLNRLEEVVDLYMRDPKWINDFAMARVVRELKRQLEEKDKEI